MDLFVFLSVALIFIIGSSVGSFVNVIIDRLPRNQSIFISRSFCESCKKILTPSELIPIVSYLVLRGKCKNCKTKIKLRLLLVETICGLSYFLIFLLHVSGILNFANLIYLLLLLPIFIGIFFSDIEFGIIPDELILLFIGIVFSYLFLVEPNSIVNHFFSGAATFTFFLLLLLITGGRGMGAGDVKLSFAQGLFLGFPVILVSSYLAFLTGAAVSLILITSGKKKLRGDTIPFGPFLIFSSVISYLLGDSIILAVVKSLGL